jgi:hypothetical protein
LGQTVYSISQKTSSEGNGRSRSYRLLIRSGHQPTCGSFNPEPGPLRDPVEKRLVELLSMLFPDTHSTSEVTGILGGRNDLMQFFFNGRRVVFEVFFSPSQVPQDLRLLVQNHADVKIAILLDSDVNPKLADEYFRKKPLKQLEKHLFCHFLV